ncbi:hypothetical protein GGS24DRAFT_444781 [Hypoxylon argillaceum]|nr:hypothetical protein GGS24DRAFT_444781 [Hypoxylon argillaceum]
MPPPPPPSSTTSKTSGKRERSKPASSSAASGGSSRSRFLSATRNRVKSLNGDTCWHCGSTPVDVCHVIAQKNSQFDEAKSAGLINFDSLDDVANSIPLCSLCHRNYDTVMNPGFIFVPTDVSFFETFETADFERRKDRYALTQMPVPRFSPTAEEYRLHCISKGMVEQDSHGGLYQAYVLSDCCYRGPCRAEPLPDRLGTLFQAKTWYGDPMAALNRAFVTLPKPPGFPLALRQQLFELEQMYLLHDATYMGDNTALIASRFHSPPGDTEQRADSQTSNSDVADSSIDSGSEGQADQRSPGGAVPGGNGDIPQTKQFHQQQQLEPQILPPQSSKKYEANIDPETITEVRPYACQQSPSSPPPPTKKRVLSESSSEVVHLDHGAWFKRRKTKKGAPSSCNSPYGRFNGKDIWRWGPMQTAQDAVDFYQKVAKL